MIHIHRTGTTVTITTPYGESVECSYWPLDVPTIGVPAGSPVTIDEAFAMASFTDARFPEEHIWITTSELDAAMEAAGLLFRLDESGLKTGGYDHA